jgi:dTDP-4-amino-4,6-dideoxygalactose transaminase
MSTTDKLAMAGGKAAVNQDIPVPKWPYTLPADEHAVIEALRKGDLTSLFAGGAVEQLEEAWAQWTQTRHCIGVSNGTAALKLVLAALDIGEGDEVIVPALSFVATGLAPYYVGASPVFVDTDPVTFNLDPQRLEDVISPRSKAIIVVHLHGLPANLEVAMLANPLCRSPGPR